MQRQATVSEVAQFLSITEEAVNNSIDIGLFVTTYDNGEDKHYLDLDECHWSWVQYVSRLSEFSQFDDNAKAEATNYVKNLRVQIIEEGSYFDGLQKVAEVRMAHVYVKDMTYDLVKGVLVAMLIIVFGVYLFISK